MEVSGTSDREVCTTEHQEHQESWAQSKAKSLVLGASLENSMDQNMQMQQMQPENSSSHFTEVEILEKEIEILESQLQNEEQAKDELSRQVASSSLEIQRLVQEHEARLREIESRLLGCQNALNNVTDELATTKENLETKEDALSDLKHDLFLSEQEVNGLRDELEKQEAEGLELAQEYKGKLQMAEQKLHAIARQHQESAAQRSAVQGQMDARMETKAHQKEIDRMSNQIQDHLHHIEELEEKYRQAQLQDDEGTKRIDMLISEQQKLQQENRRLTGTISEMTQATQRTARFEEEMQRLRCQLDALQRMHQTELRTKDEQIHRLNEKLQDRSLDQPLDNSLTKQIRELHSDMSRLSMDNRARTQKNEQMMREKIALSQDVLELKQKVSDLGREKRDLAMKLTTLEKVRPVDGVVICIDLSTSLGVTLVKIAKDAFRTITSGIRARNPRAHLGVIVQESSIWTARNLSRIDVDADSSIDVSRGGGSECYETAIQNIELMISSFWSSYPRRSTRVILIGDGQAVYGCPLHLLRPFQAHGTPIHNVVVQDRFTSASAASTSQTAEMANRTMGLHFDYNGNSKSLLNDALLG